MSPTARQTSPDRYHRILVLGSPGAGKSRLAARLAEIAGLPLVRLDDLHWEIGWRRASPEVFLERLSEALHRPRWLMDGNHLDTLRVRLRFADHALLLEESPWTCLVRVARRALARRLGETGSLPAAMRRDPGYRHALSVDPRFVHKIARFRRDTRPQIFAEVASAGVALRVLEGPDDAEALLREWAAPERYDVK